MSLIEKEKTSVSPGSFPIDTSKFNNNVLGVSDNTLQAAFDKIETINLFEYLSLDSISPATLTVSNAVFTQPSNSTITLAIKQDSQLELSFTGNFIFSLGLANYGEFKFILDGPTPLEKTFKIPYKPSSISQTICLEWLTSELDEGNYDLKIEIRNTDNTGATLTLNTGSEFFAIENPVKSLSRTLTGTVLDYENNPVENATVASGSFNTLTDSNGDYTLTGLPNYGATLVTVTKSGFKSSSAYVNLKDGNASKNFTLNYFSVSGEIRGYLNRPLIDASVSIASVSPPIDFSGDYIYEFNNIPPGTYDFHFTDSNHITNIQQLTISNTDLVVNKNLLPNVLEGTLTSSITNEVIPNLKFTVGSKLEITDNVGTYRVKDISQGPIDFITLDDPRFESKSDSVNIAMGDNLYDTTVIPKAIPAGVKEIVSPPYASSTNVLYANKFTVNRNMLFVGWRLGFITNTENYVNVRLRLWNNSGTLLTSTTNYFLQESVNSIYGYKRDITAPSSINLIAGTTYVIGIYVEPNVGSLLPPMRLNNTAGTYSSESPHLKKFINFTSPSYYNNSDAFPTLTVPNNGIVYLDAMVKM